MNIELLKLIKVLRIIRKIQKQREVNNISCLVNATRLWNAIDGMINPEGYWLIMQGSLPWAFRDYKNANSIRFAYRKPIGGLRMFQGGEV